MDSPKLTRRTLLKAGAGAAAFATTSNIFTPLKTFAARDQKLIFWLQPNFNPTADRILEDQTRAFAKQAGLKDSELQILSGLAVIVEEVAGDEQAEVTAEKSFVDDLDIDSLSMVEIAVQAEDKFGVKIPDDELANLKTVGDAVTYIASNV